MFRNGANPFSGCHQCNMPPALTYSDDDGDGNDGLFTPKEYKQNTRVNKTNGAGRATRANTALNSKPGTLTSATAPTGDLYNDEDDEEEEYEDEDDEDADPDSGGFLSKPKLPAHQYASRSLSDITRKYACCEIIAGCSCTLLLVQDGSPATDRASFFSLP